MVRRPLGEIATTNTVVKVRGPGKENKDPDDDLADAFSGLLLRTEKSKVEKPTVKKAVQGKLAEWRDRYETTGAVVPTPTAPSTLTGKSGWPCTLCKKSNSLDRDNCVVCLEPRP